MVRNAESGRVQVRVMLPKGALYEERPLPAAWSAFMPEAGIAGSPLDAFVFSRLHLHSGQYLTVRVYAYCHISEDGALSHVLLAVPDGENPALEDLRSYEAQMGRFLHRHFDVLGWGNFPAVKKLLSVRYNVSI